MERQRKKQGKMEIQRIILKNFNQSQKAHEKSKLSLEGNRAKKGKSVQEIALISNAWGTTTITCLEVSMQ